MVEVSLVPHPDFPSVAIDAIDVVIERPERSALKIHYRLIGNLDDIVLPDAGLPARRDELWRTTCFELFAREPGEAGYREFNFSPSAAWAVYCFDDRRAGMRIADVERAPMIAVSRHPNMLSIDVDAASTMFEHHLQANFAAVIEATDGTRSYWALAHAPGLPDFHDPDCFIATLPAPSGA